MLSMFPWQHLDWILWWMTVTVGIAFGGSRWASAPEGMLLLACYTLDVCLNGSTRVYLAERHFVIMHVTVYRFHVHVGGPADQQGHLKYCICKYFSACCEAFVCTQVPYTHAKLVAQLSSNSVVVCVQLLSYAQLLSRPATVKMFRIILKHMGRWLLHCSIQSKFAQLPMKWNNAARA